jgi:hypothetical protein
LGFRAGPGQRRDSFGGHIDAIELDGKLAALLQALDVEVPDADAKLTVSLTSTRGMPLAC